jgi:hypothetical protein
MLLGKLNYRKMKRLNLLIIFVSIAGMLSAQGIKSAEKITSTTNTKDFDRFVLYTLPKTSIAIKITTSRNITFCGPYAAYASEFLGIKNAALGNKEEWNIDSISITPYSESNADEYYIASVEKGFDPKALFDLSEAGLIFNPSFQNEKCIKNNIAKPEVKSTFYNLSVQKFYNEGADTLYKTILKDSIYVRIPVIKPKFELKTLWEKSKEAADVIMKIRQRRFDMIISEEEALPEANSFKVDLAELKKMEDEYLELFTGKKVLQKFTTQLINTPKTTDSSSILCNFSKSRGLTNDSTTISEPIILKIEKENNTFKVKNLLKGKEAQSKNQLLYSLPDVAYISVQIGSNTLFSQKILVHQFGTVVPFPCK